ncbi:hypothetical protein FB451DRAFT_1566214 [Mycena latifolia]|nr:hypothetical protein FB451DRAFT_1566214 [Mycena latifolia]
MRRSSSATRPGDDGRPFDFKAAYNIMCANAQRQKKRKRDEPVKSVQGLGRGIRKLAALFGEVSHIIAEAQAYERDPYEEDHGIDEFSRDVTEEEIKWLEEKRRQVPSRRSGIHRLIPSLTSKVAKLDPTDAADYFTLIQKGANDARSEDLRRITVLMGNLINAERDRPELAVFDHTYSTPSITETNENGEPVVVKQKAPLLHPSDRSTRGPQHDVTGGLLSTTNVNWKDPKRVVCHSLLHLADSSVSRTRREVRSGDIPLAGTFYARVYYAGFQGNPNKVEEGFLKSRYLVKSYKAVFTTPTSADEDDENTQPSKKAKMAKATKAVRKCVADLLGMNGKVTPRSIAYIVILVYFALTNASTWMPEYYGVSLPQMYDFIVDFFDTPAPGTAAKARVDALLAWWNKQIFPTHAASAAVHRTAVDSRSQLRAQRAAMEAEATAAAEGAAMEAE